MTLINSVKKVLRQTGYEMDADDVADTLSTWLHYPRGITRTQTANALQSLCTTDPDVVRTRKGMYQYRAAARPPTYAISNTAEPAQPPNSQPSVFQLSDFGQPIWPTSHDQAATAAQRPPILILAETNYVHDRLTESAPTGPGPVPNVPVLSGYLVSLAEERYARSAHVEWQPGSIAITAAITRHQYSGQDIAIIADVAVVGEAVSTARRVGRPIRQWILGSDSALPTGSEVCDILHLRTTDLLNCVRRGKIETTAPSATASLVPNRASQPPVDGRGRGSCRHDASSDFDSLSYLDDSLYRQPIRGVTGRGNTHTLRRQATLVGSTYAVRWLSVVNDETRERLIASGDGMKVPGRLYGDLLGFTETHGLPPHDSAVIKDHLRRGFWETIHGDSRSVKGTAA